MAQNITCWWFNFCFFTSHRPKKQQQLSNPTNWCCVTGFCSLGRVEPTKHGSYDRGKGAHCQVTAVCERPICGFSARNLNNRSSRSRSRQQACARLIECRTPAQDIHMGRPRDHGRDRTGSTSGSSRYRGVRLQPVLINGVIKCSKHSRTCELIIKMSSSKKCKKNTTYTECLFDKRIKNSMLCCNTSSFCGLKLKLPDVKFPQKNRLLCTTQRNRHNATLHALKSQWCVKQASNVRSQPSLLVSRKLSPGTSVTRRKKKNPSNSALLPVIPYTRVWFAAH